MTNDYLKGHDYRMRTDANYRARHDAAAKRKFKTPTKDGPKTCRCGARASEYHHFSRGRGRWVCKTCHARIHGAKRGKTPYR